MNSRKNTGLTGVLREDLRRVAGKVVGSIMARHLLEHTDGLVKQEVHADKNPEEAYLLAFESSVRTLFLSSSETVIREILSEFSEELGKPVNSMEDLLQHYSEAHKGQND
ncbi:MAG: hypothetical protein QW767_00515 [Thermoprotei archaeon]